MLIMYALLNFLICFCQFQPSFFAQDLMNDFKLTQSGFSWITSIPMLVGLFLSAVCGGLADKFGIRRTLLLGLIVSSLAMVSRAFCSVYVLLLISCALLGIAASFLSATMAKMCMLWFPQRQIGLAIGVINATGSGGIAAAQALNGVIFPDYHAAFLGGGAALAVATVLWAILGRDRASISDITELEDEPQKKKKADYKKVLKNKGIWEAGLAGALYNGFNVTVSGLLITALVSFWGVDPVQAGVVSSCFTIGMVFGSILLPTFIPRFSSAKVMCILVPLISMACVFSGWNIDDNLVRCVLFVIGGMFFGGQMPIYVSFPSILPGIGNENSGSAGGLMMSIMMIGSVCIPSLIITPISGSDYNLMMILVCIVGALEAIPFALLPSIYAGKKEKK
jgi:MFS family permease